MKRNTMIEVGIAFGFILVIGIGLIRPYLVYQKYGMEGVKYFIINGRGPMEMEWRNR